MAANGFGIGDVSSIVAATGFAVVKLRSSATASKVSSSLISHNAMIAEVARVCEVKVE